MSVSAASDEDLMGRAQANDTAAFAQLYDRHVARALRVAGAVCRDTGRTEDAVQDAFLSIWRTRASFEADRGSFVAWSMRIVRHRAIDSVRREAARPRPAGAEEEAPAAETRSLPDEVVARSEGEALRASLGKLPAAQAEVVSLAFFGEMSHSEIADRLSLPPGTVKGRMRLGLHKLRSQMEREG